jgi:integrase
MGVVTRPDSPYYQLNIERGKGLRCLRRATTIPHTTGNKEQDAENKRLALVAYHHALSNLARGRLNLPVDTDAPAASTSPTLAAFLDADYREWLRREHPSSAAQAIGRLDRHFVPIFGTVPLDQIDRARIEAWRKKRRRDGVSAHTIGRDLSDLRGLLSNAVDMGVLDASPLAGLRTKAAPSREIIRYLTPAEEARLMKALVARDADGIEARRSFNAWREARGLAPLPVPRRFKDSLTPLVIVALNTGARPAELFRLTWASVDFRARDLVINWWVSKVRRTRHLPLNADALRALERWRAHVGTPAADTLIFPGKGGKPYTGAPKSWDEIIRATKIPRFRFQDLRHTFASKLVQRGINLRVVQQLMGHASITTTERYAHLAPSQSRQAVNALRRKGVSAFARG